MYKINNYGRFKKSTKKNDYSESSKPKKYFEQWMKEIPDDIKISELTIPGTHDSCAYQIKGIGNLVSYATKTQSWNLEEQMKAGLRYFDIRLRSINNTLHCYHGPIDLNQKFDSILKIASSFLNKNKTETILMQIVSEYDDKNCTKSMEQMYQEYTINYKNIIIEYDNNNIPTLGEIRGKLFFFKIMKGSTRNISNFYIQNSWTCNTINQIGKKIKKIKTQFHRAASFNEINHNSFFLNYLSSSSDYIMMSPLQSAKKCNKIAFEYDGRLGIVLADFPGEGLIEYLILQNFGGMNKIKEEINKSTILLTNGNRLRGRKKEDNLLINDIKENVYQSSICLRNFGINYLNEEEEIHNNDSVYFQHVDTERFLYYHEGQQKLFCKKDEKTIFSILNSKKNIESGDEIALIIGSKIFGGILYKINEQNEQIKNKSLVAIVLYVGEQNKCLKTGYENKNKELKNGILNLQYQDELKKNFENYFIINKQ